MAATLKSTKDPNPAIRMLILFLKVTEFETRGNIFLNHYVSPAVVADLL